MSEIRVRNSAWMDRMRIQALLQQIAQRRGNSPMWDMLEQAVDAEGRRQKQERDRAQSNE